MATVSLSFALCTALKAPVWLAVIFALLWGLAIMTLDRLFVVSMHRYRNRFFYLLMAAPRFAMAVLLGFVISTPFVLQIFQPEIQHQIKLIQAAERSAYFQGLPHNPVYLAVQQDQARVNTLTDEAATGGAAINPSQDPTILGWQNQLTTAQANEQTWFANLQCQLYGTALPGGRKCIQGNGPLAKDDQQEYEYWKDQVSTLQGEIQQRTGTLRGQSAAQQQANQGQAHAELTAANLALSSAQQQLTLQTNGVTNNINADTGLLTQLKALNNATAGNSTLGMARFLLFLVFLLIDSMPVFIKLLLNLAPESTYDVLLAAEEQQQKRVAEHTRAIRQAAQRKAAQAEASGARDRLAALSAELPGMRDDIAAARLRVEQEWLRRWESDQMRRVASGQGITPADTGVGPMPSPESWQWYVANGSHAWPPPRTFRATRDERRPHRSTADRRADPARPRGVDERLWGWLGSLRLPRLNLSWQRNGRREGSQFRRWPTSGADSSGPAAYAQRPTQPDGNGQFVSSSAAYAETRPDARYNEMWADTAPLSAPVDEDAAQFGEPYDGDSAEDAGPDGRYGY
jgi:hypothetical protein